MLKNSLILFVTLLLSACQQPLDWHRNLPAISYTPVKTINVPGKLTAKYTVHVVNAGLEVYVIIDNGYNEFMMIDKLALYGNRCGYESQNEIIVPPSSVSTFMVPNIALLGLCYTDDIKMVFVSKKFNGLSSENKKMAVPVEVVMRFKLTSTKKYEEYVNVIYSQWD